METPGPQDSARSPGRTGFVPGPPAAPGADAHRAGWVSGALGPPAPGRLDLESWVREKVLFLLDPQRGLRAARGGDGGAAGLEGARGVDGARGADGSARGAPARRPPEPAAPARRPLLVRVEEARVTREVLRAACARGRVTRCTEERALTAVTFRAGRD